MKKLVDILTLEQFVNTIPREDLVSRQRLRLFKIATLLSLFVCLGFLVQVLIILPHIPLLVGGMFLLFCILFVNYFAVLRHKKPSVSFIILLAVWFILIHVNAYFSGGVKNSGNFYLAAVVLTAFILLGTRGGKIMAALCVLHVAYFFVITNYTHLVTYDLVGTGETLLNVYFLLSTSVSLLVLAAASNFIEKSKNAVVNSLNIKNDELTEASTRLQLSTGAAGIGIWDHDLVTGVINWDSTMYALYGLPGQNTIDFSRWGSRIYPDDLIKLQQRLKTALERQQNFEAEYKIVWPDGTIRHVKSVSQIHRDNNGAAVRTVGATWDITERKKAAEAILKSNQRYELATKATSNAIWDWDLVTDEHYWSEGYVLTFGETKEGLSESFKTYASRIHPDDYERVYNGLMEVLDGLKGDYWEAEYRFLKADRSWAHVYDRGYLIFDEQNKPVRFVGAMQDVTARKGVEMEREMIIQELIKTNSHLKQFSFITSHNLRAPLSNISAILDLIDQTSLDEHNKQMLDMLKASGKQLGKTIDDLTNIMLIKNNRNAEISRININDTLSEIMKSFSATVAEVGGGIRTNISVPYVWFHKVYLESMFVNLISNSIKYRSPHRKLLICIKGNCDANGDCVITFSDNGMGIDLERYKDRMFGLYQRFHKTSEGQGLGLFIVKSQIEALGGDITVASQVDKGTTFSIIFKNHPVAAASEATEMLLV